MVATTSSKELLVALAHQLAQEACISRVSTATIAALCSLLPGLKYYSLGVCSPGSTTSIVASSSCARAGPATLSLYTFKNSALGIVASKGQGLQASLDGAAGAILISFSDVAEMLQAAPACTFAVCLPISPAPGAQGVTGALLLGFSLMPNLNRQRLAGLSALCRLLSVHMEDTAEEISCIVERMIGAHKGCVCCVDYCSEPAIPESAYAPTSCKEDSLGPGDRGASGQASLVLAPIEEHPDEDAAMLHMTPSSPTASPTYSKGHQQQQQQSWEFERQPQKVRKDLSKTSYIDWLRQIESDLETIMSSKGSSKGITTQGSYAAPPPPTSLEPAPPTLALSLSSPGLNSQTTFRYNKSLLYSLTPEDIQSKHPVWLSYSRSDLESEFGRWHQRRVAPIDFVYTVLTMMALALLLVVYPQALQKDSSGPKPFSMLAFIPLLVPLTMASMFNGAYLRHRECVVLAVRLYLVSLLAFLPAHSWASLTASQSLGWWIASWVEVLLTPAVGLQLRLSRHMPFQLALLAVLCIMICKAGGGVATWGFYAIATCGGFGFALPTAVLYRSEARSRSIFAQELATVACA